MKKKLFLLPFLALSLALAGCSFSDEGGEGGEGGQGGQPAAKEIWEEDLVEGESTFAQVKAGTAGQYYKVRGTVAGNAGSTFSLYRNGEYLYCYNFNPDATANGGNDKLQEHPLGAYVEVYAQSSEYSGSVQLTAYNVGTNKTAKNYDGDAYLTKIADRGETVVPKIGQAEADFANATATAAMMKVNFVPKKDFTFSKSATVNQDIVGRVGEYEITLRCDTYLSADAKAALFGDEGLKLAVGNTYEIVALAVATSSMSCRLLVVDSFSCTLISAPQWTDPTSVEIEAEGDVTELEVGESLQLYFTVKPATAKPSVVWSSEDETILTVDEDGLVKAKAVGKKHIYATAANGEVTAVGEYEIEVKPASITVTKVTAPVAGTKYKAALLYNGETLYYSTGAMSGNFGETKTDLDLAADWELVAVTGGYNIKITLPDDSVKYANAVVSGTYFNFKIESSASTVWSFNTTWHGFTVMNGETEYYMGTSRTYNTISLSKSSFITDSNVDVAGGQYPVHLYTVA